MINEAYCVLFLNGGDRGNDKKKYDKIVVGSRGTYHKSEKKTSEKSNNKYGGAVEQDN